MVLHSLKILIMNQCITLIGCFIHFFFASIGPLQANVRRYNNIMSDVYGIDTRDVMYDGAEGNV